MEQAAVAALAPWANFYVITGSSAGALTGLQFVAMSLVAQLETPASMREIRAFGTPTIVQFCVALLISAIMCAPWYAFSHLALCLGAFAILGLLYGIRVVVHARKQEGYRPDLSDWLWYAALPLIAYAALSFSAIALTWNPPWFLFAIAATSLSFLFIGIHNAWDGVTYIAVDRRQTANKDVE